MKHDIVRKLQKHLSDPMTTECVAVYLLVEVRKILEESKLTPPLYVLWMYCQWAVHVDPTRDSMMRRFLKRDPESDLPGYSVGDCECQTDRVLEARLALSYVTTSLECVSQLHQRLEEVPGQIFRSQRHSTAEAGALNG